MHKQKKILSITSGVAIVATFLPWFSVSASAFGFSMSRSKNGFNGIGVLYFFLMAIIFILSIIGNAQKPHEKNTRLGVLISGILSIICLFFAFIQADDNA